MRNRTKITTVAVLGLLVVVVIVAAQPVLAWDKGCTPGFWKQEHHFDLWPCGWSPDDDICDMFGSATTCGDTLLDALKYHGGPGLEGAERILLRYAVGYVLSAETFGGCGAAAADNVFGRVNDKLDSGSRGAMLSTAEWFGERLEESYCPDVCDPEFWPDCP